MISLLFIIEQKNGSPVFFFWFFTNGKHYQACELDMNTLRNRAKQSYMT